MASLKYKDPETGKWKKVSAGGGASYDAKLSAHVNNKNNPHNVTAKQIDVYTKNEIDMKLASIYTYGTEDIEEGSVSPYENGHIHFVIE